MNPTSRVRQKVMVERDIKSIIQRVADALDRLSPPAKPTSILKDANAFVWNAERLELIPVSNVNRLELSLLIGIEQARDILLKNTRQFAAGYPANNALLWGARGMGKSSLVKAVHGKISSEHKVPPVLIELQREELSSLPILLNILRKEERRFILFCDDLSFDAHDSSYKSLKAILEGGIEGRPKNVLFYATSNRRHLMPRDMIENEQSSAINPGESVQEKVSLSDRFGIWLGFHNCDQETFMSILEGYVKFYGLEIDKETLRHEAIEWSMTRGARSGRVAWQYIQDLAGRLEKTLP